MRHIRSATRDRIYDRRRKIGPTAVVKPHVATSCAKPRQANARPGGIVTRRRRFEHVQASQMRSTAVCAVSAVPAHRPPCFSLSYETMALRTIGAGLPYIDHTRRIVYPKAMGS